MAFGLESLGITAVAEGVPAFVRSVGDMQSAITQTADAGDSLGGRLASLGGVALGVAEAGLAAAAAGFAALTVAIAGCIRAAAEEEGTLARIDQMLINTGRSSEFSVEQAEALARQYRDLAGGSEDAVLAIEDMALRMGTVSGEQMPDFIQTTLDLAAATGTDAAGAARLLAQSMEYPTSALRRFRSMGILVDQATLDQMQAFEDAGDTAGAYGLLLQTISRSTMGQAARRAGTLSGQMEILRNHFAETAQEIGRPFLGPLENVMTQISRFADRVLPMVVEAFQRYLQPAIEGAINAFGDWLAAGNLDRVAAWLGEKIPAALEFLSGLWHNALLPAMQAIWGWMQSNLLPVLELLWSWLQEQLPVAVQFIRDAWEQNFLPVWETFIGSMQENVFPLFDQLRAWLAENLPIAIQTLSDFWTNTLQPAIATFWDWYTTNVFPRFQELAMWLSENIPVAIRALADFWTRTLLPAIQRVWTWMQGTLFPFLGALADFLSATVGYAVRVLAAAWREYLWPALQDVFRWIAQHVQPVLEWLGEEIMPVIVDIFQRFSDTLRNLTEPLRILADHIRHLELPDWLQPGSPTPFELALQGINEQMDRLTRVNLPAFNYQMTAARMVPAPATASSTTNNYTLNIATSAAAEPIAADFRLLASLRGR